MGGGRVLGPRGSSEEARAAALTASDGVGHHAASQPAPSYRVTGALPAGFDRTPRRRPTLWPGVRVGPCGRQALLKRPQPRGASASPGRQAGRTPGHPLGARARQRKSRRVCARGPRLRHLGAHGSATAGPAHGARVRRWWQAKKAGGSAGRAAPPRPGPRTLREPAHHASDRQLFLRHALPHPHGSPQAFRTGFAHLDNLGP